MLWITAGMTNSIPTYVHVSKKGFSVCLNYNTWKKVSIWRLTSHSIKNVYLKLFKTFVFCMSIIYKSTMFMHVTFNNLIPTSKKTHRISITKFTLNVFFPWYKRRRFLPHKTTCMIIILYILIFMFLGRMEEKICMASSECSLFHISLWVQFWFIAIIPE